MDANLRRLIERYKETDWNSLLREDMEDHHLKESKKDLDILKRFIDTIINSSLFPSLYIHYQDQLIVSLIRLERLKRRMLQYKSGDKKLFILNMVKDVASNIFSKLQPLFSLIAPLQDRDKFLKSNILKIAEDIKELERSAKELKKQQSQIVGQSVGIEASRYGDFFKKEAEKNERSATRYMRLITGVSLLFFLLAYFIFKFDSSITYKNIPELIIKGNLINKFFIFTVALLFLSILRRGFLASNHQYTINIFRHNALYSHKEILASIQKTEDNSDKEIYNSILLEFTKTMFSHQDTGYIKEEGKSHSSITEIPKTFFNNSSNK